MTQSSYLFVFHYKTNDFFRMKNLSALYVKTEIRSNNWLRKDHERSESDCDLESRVTVSGTRICQTAAPTTTVVRIIVHEIQRSVRHMYESFCMYTVLFNTYYFLLVNLYNCVWEVHGYIVCFSRGRVLCNSRLLATVFIVQTLVYDT